MFLGDRLCWWRATDFRVSCTWVWILTALYERPWVSIQWVLVFSGPKDSIYTVELASCSPNLPLLLWHTVRLCFQLPFQSDMVIWLHSTQTNSWAWPINILPSDSHLSFPIHSLMRETLEALEPILDSAYSVEGTWTLNLEHLQWTRSKLEINSTGLSHWDSGIHLLQ